MFDVQADEVAERWGASKAAELEPALCVRGGATQPVLRAHPLVALRLTGVRTAFSAKWQVPDPVIDRRLRQGEAFRYLVDREVLLDSQRSGLLLAEGYKRSRNTVGVCNSDPAIVVLCAMWVHRFARNPVRYSVQYHADQDLTELQEFWARQLSVAPEEIRLQRKSNSGRLSGRTWRSRYGVLNVYAGDTVFRSRLQAWMDCLQELWVDSAASGRSSAW